MKRARTWAVLLLAAALVATALAMVSARKPQTLTLPDGSTLAVLKTTYGQTTHRMFRGNAWEKVLYGWVPTEWLDMCRLSSSPATASFRRTVALRAMKHISAAYTTTNTLVVWFERRSTNATPGSLSVLPVDEHGQAWGTGPATIYTLSANMTGWGTAATTATTAPQRSVFSVSCPVFPRRGPTVRLRVFANNAVAGEFTVANPARRDYPRWTAAPLPATVSRDGYDFALTNLSTGADFIYHSPRPAAAGEIGNSRAQFRLTRSGKWSDAWSVVGLEAEDATGNRWPSISPSISGGFTIVSGGRLPTNEVLKVRATFSREGDFETNGAWHVSGVPLPPPGSYLQFTNLSTNFNGVRLSLVGISAGGAQIPMSGISSSEPLVHFQIDPQINQAQWRVNILRVTDSAGAPLELRRGARSLLSRNLACPFRYPSGLTNANFVFALHQPVTVEFMAQASVP